MKQDRSIKTLHRIMSFESQKWQKRQSKMITQRESQAVGSKHESSTIHRSLSMNPPSRSEKPTLAPAYATTKLISVEESEKIMQKAEGAVLFHCRQIAGTID
jgi:hypothetical protein